MTEDFRAALDEGRGERVYGSLLQSLDVYVRTHFGFEERCMEQYHCPVAKRNREAHVRFVDVLSGYQARYAATGFERADARHLMDTLDRWLAHHIGHIDVHLKQSGLSRCKNTTYKISWLVFLWPEGSGVHDRRRDWPDAGNRWAGAFQNLKIG
jgi:hemerythrin-like metal-binding protein